MDKESYRGCLARAPNQAQREAVKLCECGCGQPAPIAKRTRGKRGVKKGQPLRYIHGHNSRKKNSEYKRSKQIAPNGYIYIYEGPGKRRLEHIVVAEQILGRPLKNDEVVHHKNGDKENNRPENIEILKRGEHTEIHNAKRRRLKTKQAIDHGKQCKRCLKHKPAQEFTKLKQSADGLDYWCRACKAEAWQQYRGRYNNA